MIKTICKASIKDTNIEDARELPYPCLLVHDKIPCIVLAVISQGKEYFRGFIIQLSNPDVEIGFVSNSFPIQNFGKENGYNFYDGEITLKNNYD